MINDQILVNIIAAVSKNGIIGNRGDIPWHLSEDLRRFKKLTSGHVLVMGRKTFEGLKRPLGGRQLIILSSQDPSCPDNVSRIQQPQSTHYCKTIPEVFEKAQQLNTGHKGSEPLKLFVCGGTSVYKDFLPFADYAHITFLDKEYDGDTIFPPFNICEWRLESEESQELIDYVTKLPVKTKFLKYKKEVKNVLKVPQASRDTG